MTAEEEKLSPMKLEEPPNIKIFITITDIKDINEELKEKSDIYVVDKGTFTKEE